MPLGLSILSLINVLNGETLIINDDLLNLNEWDTNGINYGISTNNCPTNDGCVYIGKETFISKTFNIPSNYYSISIRYDLYINTEDDPGICCGWPSIYYSKVYMFYSCNNGIIGQLTSFDYNVNAGVYLDEGGLLTNYDCHNDISNITIYFAAYSDKRIMYVNNLRILGTQGMSAQDIPDIIFKDDFNDYNINWNILSGASNILTRMNSNFCFRSPCLELKDTGTIESKSISTLGYNNITIYYEVNIGPNEFLDWTERFTINIRCINVTVQQKYRGRIAIYETRFILLPSECNDNPSIFIELNQQASSQEYSFIDTIMILGISLLNQPTITPTNNPSIKPTNAPTTIPTLAPLKTPTISPSKYPTNYPSNNPTDTPTRTPVDVPITQYPTYSPTVNPTSYPTKSPYLYYTFKPTTFPTTLPSLTPIAAPINQDTTGQTAKQSNASTYILIFVCALIVVTAFSCVWLICYMMKSQKALQDQLNMSSSIQSNVSINHFMSPNQDSTNNINMNKNDKIEPIRHHKSDTNIEELFNEGMNTTEGDDKYTQGNV